MVAAHTSAGKTVGLFVQPEELYTLHSHRLRFRYIYIYIIDFKHVNEWWFVLKLYGRGCPSSGPIGS